MITFTTSNTTIAKIDTNLQDYVVCSHSGGVTLGRYPRLTKYNKATYQYREKQFQSNDTRNTTKCSQWGRIRGNNPLQITHWYHWLKLKY